MKQYVAKQSSRTGQPSPQSSRRPPRIRVVSFVLDLLATGHVHSQALAEWVHLRHLFAESCSENLSFRTTRNSSRKGAEVFRLSSCRWTVRGKHIARCPTEALHGPSTTRKISSCKLDNALPRTKTPTQLQGPRPSDTLDKRASYHTVVVLLTATVHHHPLLLLWLPDLLLQ